MIEIFGPEYRFNVAVAHNQQLLKHYENNWNKKFNSTVEKIKNL